MTRGESIFLTISTAIVAGTGCVYGWMAWCLESADPDAIVGHPLQPDVQHAHVVAAPLLVFAFGLLWRAHILPRMKADPGERRASGLALLALIVPMVASGYLLQVAADPAWREVWAWTHGISSLAWTLAFLAHRLGRLRSSHTRVRPRASERGLATSSD